MKNLLVFLTLVSVAYYFYTHPRVETVLQPVAVSAPMPPPLQPQPLYFHSPLDAPAMSTSASTGTGYFSADPNSRFTNYQGGYYPSFQAAGGYPVVYAGGTTNNNVTYNNYGGRSGAARVPVAARPPYIVERPLTRAGHGQPADSQRNVYPQRTVN